MKLNPVDPEFPAIDQHNHMILEFSNFLFFKRDLSKEIFDKFSGSPCCYCKKASSDMLIHSQMETVKIESYCSICYSRYPRISSKTNQAHIEVSSYEDFKVSYDNFVANSAMLYTLMEPVSLMNNIDNYINSMKYCKDHKTVTTDSISLQVFDGNVFSFPSCTECVKTLNSFWSQNLIPYSVIREYLEMKLVHML